jgi:hypothetical protein
LKKSVHQHFLHIIYILASIVVTGCTTSSNAGAALTQIPSNSATPDPTPSSMPSSIDLDLREANVTAVEYKDLGNGMYLFTVTLFHDDAGEAPSFADWWQVEDTSGVLLGRRILAHSHGTQPFSRSETISIPVNVSTIIVRGHDMLHGYGGQAIRIDLLTGEQAVYDEDAGSTP